ncbi:helix-turn-helix domain-containing protein [Mesorhizobium sp. M0522]|uniref:helix-turn-helix domain-containing protein n=1 Tax=unclassified Mesorhizobium TaxID=325217 RepID=UPI0033386AA6
MELTKNFYTIKDLMHLTGVSRATIYNMRARGALQFRKFGGRPVVLRDDFDRYMDALPLVPAEPGPLPSHLRKSA